MRETVLPMHLDRIDFRPDDFPVSDTYPFNLPFFPAVTSIPLSGPAVMFAGDNGSGKSTVLQAIARSAGIHIWSGFQRTRYHKSPYEEALHFFCTPVWTNGPVDGAFFASELFKGFARLLDEWASSDPGVLEFFGARSLLTLSHGQGHMAWFRSRFSRVGLYLLDEPETALSPATQIELLAILREAIAEGNAQFIIATHSPILLSLEGATIVDFDSPDLATVEFLDTSHYRVYRDFFANLP
jgi:predicted ATPase